MTEIQNVQQAQELLDFIDDSPSPWHAVANMTDMLRAAGFGELREDEPWHLQPGDAAYVVREDASLVAFRVGERHPADSGFRVVAAHTDSPGLRVKPGGAHTAGPFLRLGVEVYGGPILPTFADRDLTLAGRLAVRGEAGIDSVLVDFPEALARIPTAAIHLNREVNEQGLKLDRQKELPLILSLPGDDAPDPNRFRELLASRAGVDSADVLGWDLAVADTQPGAFFGAEREFIAAARLDNLASCHAGLKALLAAEAPTATVVCAFFDHEEIGSTSYRGASGTFLPDVLERLAGEREPLQRAKARSRLLSVDMAHAWHPNYPHFYDDEHKAQVNHGPVIKVNANQRYTSEGAGSAWFAQICQDAGVPWQHYVHRTDLPCGSTIGPITAARLGIPVIDVGNAIWSMHSVRESAGAKDHAWMTGALHQFLAVPKLP